MRNDEAFPSDKNSVGLRFPLHASAIKRYKVPLHVFSRIDPKCSNKLKYRQVAHYSRHCRFVRLSGYDIFTSGLPLEVDPILNLNTVCKNTPSLNKDQLELCKTHADVVASALQGAQMAVHECKQQFAYSRWNCSSLESKNRNPLTSALLARGEYMHYFLAINSILSFFPGAKTFHKRPFVALRSIHIHRKAKRRVYCLTRTSSRIFMIVQRGGNNRNKQQTNMRDC